MTRLRPLVVLASVVALALSSTAAPRARPAAAPSLTARLTQALVSPGLSLGRTGAVAVDLQTGTVVYAHRGTTPVVPASNEKLPVAWTALLRLGPAYRFHTELYGVGTRLGSTWDGDLVLKGFGDPTLKLADLDRIAAAVRTSGVEHVTGRVRGDESYYDRERGAPGWKLGFVGVETPPLSALVVDRAQGWPALSPPLLAAKALTAALARAGVRVDGRPGLGEAPATAEPLATDTSKPLGQIVHFMNHTSDNFTAEMLLKQLGAALGSGGTTAAGASFVVETLRQAGIPTAGVRIVDGSGLSELDRLTPASIVGVLRAAWLSEELQVPFVRSLPVAGENGTMRHRLPSLRGLVRAKTGTTDLAASLSGYVGARYAFAVLENGHPVAYWSARGVQDRFVTLLAGAA